MIIRLLQTYLNVKSYKIRLFCNRFTISVTN
nr:MAG TPA: hypothetical protein [Caudoviricetes sp.]